MYIITHHQMPAASGVELLEHSLQHPAPAGGLDRAQIRSRRLLAKLIVRLLKAKREGLSAE